MIQKGMSFSSTRRRIFMSPLDHRVKIIVDQDKDERLNSSWSMLKHNLCTTWDLVAW
jgi:hypothetical protein